MHKLHDPFVSSVRTGNQWLKRVLPKINGRRLTQAAVLYPCLLYTSLGRRSAYSRQALLSAAAVPKNSSFLPFPLCNHRTLPLSQKRTSPLPLSVCTPGKYCRHTLSLIHIWIPPDSLKTARRNPSGRKPCVSCPSAAPAIPILSFPPAVISHPPAAGKTLTHFSGL